MASAAPNPFTDSTRSSKGLTDTKVDQNPAGPAGPPVDAAANGREYLYSSAPSFSAMQPGAYPGFPVPPHPNLHSSAHLTDLYPQMCFQHPPGPVEDASRIAAAHAGFGRGPKPLGKFAFRGHKKKWLIAEKNGLTLHHHLPEHGTAGHFFVEELVTGKVVLRANNNLFVASDAAGKCYLHDNIECPDCQFTIEKDSGKVYLRTSHGRYLSQETFGNTVVAHHHRGHHQQFEQTVM